MIFAGSQVEIPSDIRLAVNAASSPQQHPERYALAWSGTDVNRGLGVDVVLMH